MTGLWIQVIGLPKYIRSMHVFAPTQGRTSASRPRLRFVRQVRIGDHRPRHAHQVYPAGGEDLLGHDRVRDLARMENGEVDHFLESQQLG